MSVPDRQPDDSERRRALLAEWERIQCELTEAQAGMTDEGRDATVEEISAEIKQNITNRLRAAFSSS